MDWKLLSFVLSSEQRELVLKTLDKPTTPTRIAKEAKITKAHVSRILKEFEKRGLAECKTPGKRKGKIYVITEKGSAILTKIK